MKYLFYLFAVAMLLPLAGYTQTVTGRSASQQITLMPPIPAPTSPAKLVISNIRFADKDGNDIINAGESSIIGFTITNSGTGNAYAVTPEISSGLSGIVVSQIAPAGTIRPGSSVEVKATLRATMDIETRRSKFKVSAVEGNGFNAEPQYLTIGSKAFESPKVVVADTRFFTEHGGSAVPRGSVVTMQVLVQNQGLGDAADVVLEFVQPNENVFKLTNDTKVNIGTLKAGQQSVYEYKFMVNKLFADATLNIKTVVIESAGKYGQVRDNMLPIDVPVTQSAMIEIMGDYSSPVIEVGSLHVDIDRNIPQRGVARNNIFALVIGNEHYSEASGTGREVDVPYAISDAAVVEQYFINTLGIAKENIIFRRNGTSAQIHSDIDRLCNTAASYPGKDAEIFVYYAGHGLSDNEKTSYIMPVDIAGTNVKMGIKLDQLYRKLGNLAGVRSTVIIDACFSGGARAGELLAARGMKIEPNADVIPGQIVIFTAASGAQTAFPYTEKRHGMFTYFLLKKLQSTSGDVSYSDMAKYIQQQVQHNSYKLNNTEQTPAILVGLEVGNSWQEWKF